MNILCYTNKMNNGGAERVMSILVNELHARGHAVVLVNDYQFPNEYAIHPDVAHLYIDGPYQAGRGKAWQRTLHRVAFLRKECKARKIDMVISFIKEVNYRAIAATFGLKTKNIISVRIDPSTAYKTKGKAAMAKFFYAHAEGCVFQTPKAMHWYPERVQRHGRVILNPVSDAFFHTAGAPGKEKRIVSSGRLSRQKRFDVLIRAFASVHEKFPDYTLEIYGEGEKKEELEKLIAELGLSNCAFLKGRSDRIQDDIKDASLFVLPSDFEGLPNALMEAMVLGLPCVSTDCDGDGARVIIDDHVNGIICPKGDSEKMANAVCEILGNPSLARSMSQKARDKGQSFSKKLIIDQWEEFITSIVHP